MTFEEAARALLAHPFRFAKTMPDHPHWYTNRRDWVDQDLFDQVVQFIRDNAEVEWFKCRPYRMFYLNGMKYWTMGAPVGMTILINKAEHVTASPYDAIADRYDRLFDDEESRLLERELFEHLRIEGKVLDIGCGTGLLLDYVRPDEYTGVDPSAMMLDIFRERNPDYADKVVCCRFEEFFGEGYDTIVALFGVPSYIEPKALERIPGMLKPGGRAYLMFFQDWYTPVTHLRTGLHVPIHPNTRKGVQFHSYNVVTYENL